MDKLVLFKQEKMRRLALMERHERRDMISELIKEKDVLKSSAKIVSVNIINVNTGSGIEKMRKTIDVVLELNSDPNRSVINIPFWPKEEEILFFLHDLIKSINIIGEYEYPCTFIFTLILMQEYDKEKKKYLNIDLTELEPLALEYNVQIIKS